METATYSSVRSNATTAIRSTPTAASTIATWPTVGMAWSWTAVNNAMTAMPIAMTTVYPVVEKRAAAMELSTKGSKNVMTVISKTETAA